MKNPVQHWLHQRISAFLMLFLIPFCYYVFFYPSVEQQALNLKSLGNIFLLFLFFVTAIYHMMIGLNIMIDDYVHRKLFNCFAKIFVYMKSAAALLYAAYLIFLLVRG